MRTARALASCLAFATFSAAAPAAAAWHRVDSPNFIVTGDVNVRDLRRIAAQFEAFHDALSRIFGAKTTSAPVPTVVVVFPNAEALEPYRPGSRRLLGWASADRDVNYIGMLNAGELTDRVIFHEYTHLMLANTVARVPLWLNEGLAEFYSTFTLTDGGRRAQVGLPIVEHLRGLNGSIKIPLAELLRVDYKSPRYNEDSRAGDFYAESWALIHMLLNEQPSRMADLGHYLRQVGDGADETQAWEQVFGTTRTENALRLYIKRQILGTVVVTFPEKVASLAPAETPMSEADAAGFLGALQLRVHGANAAAKLVEPALAREPANALVNSVMARIDFVRHDTGATVKRLMAAAAPNDWFAAYLDGLTLSEATRLDQLAGDAVGRDAALARAVALLDQVRHDHTELANVLAELAKIELEHDTAPTAAARTNIERARELAPGRIDYVLTHAQLFAQTREFAKARAVVGPLMTPAYPEDIRNSARRLMGELVDLEQALTAGPVPDPRSGSVAVPDADAGRPRTGARGGRFVPEYRTVQPGERRLDGVLERIDCPTGRPAVFFVRVAGGSGASGNAVQLEGTMSNVEFLSYRDDLAGGVTCGPRDPLHVYVTVREATPKPIVVAVEFLPRD